MGNTLVTVRFARKFVLNEFWPIQGLHKSVIFRCVHGFVVILYVEQFLRILGCSQCERAYNFAVVSCSFMKFHPLDRENEAFEVFEFDHGFHGCARGKYTLPNLHEQRRFLRG